LPVFIKIKVLREAHGTQEVDDVQVNGERSHLLSIGKDNRCIIWTLSPRVEKLVELEYAQALGNSNLRKMVLASTPRTYRGVGAVAAI